jgi:streptogramin lyase
LAAVALALAVTACDAIVGVGDIIVANRELDGAADAGAEASKDTGSKDTGPGDASKAETGGDAEPGPLVLAKDQNSPSGIAVDATSVYWTTYSPSPNGTVCKVPIGGGTIRTLAKGQAFPYGIAVDATGVYWTNDDNPGNISTVPVDGGSVVTLASGPGLKQPFSIAVGSGSVYWTNQTADTVDQIGIDGGTVKKLAAVGGVSGITLDPTSVYFTGIGSIYKVAMDGGTVSTVAMGAGITPTGIAVDSMNVYWTNMMNTGQVLMAPIDTGLVFTLASGQNDPDGIAIDGKSVYWTNTADPGTVQKVSIEGGAVTNLAEEQKRPMAIAVDGANVYWTTTGDGTAGTGAVMQIAK